MNTHIAPGAAQETSDTTSDWCALCGPSADDVASFPMTHGVVLRLCGYHRSDAFQRADDGRQFVGAMAMVWRSLCATGPRNARVLADHLRRFEPQPKVERPGSYTWGKLRHEVEARFAAGEDPRVVIEEVRARPHGPANPPSYRTMRRWFREARWLRNQPSHQMSVDDLTDGRGDPPAVPGRLLTNRPSG